MNKYIHFIISKNKKKCNEKSIKLTKKFIPFII